ncbi:MAG: hypothetical protein QG628_34 [Patescibacteria group bacterium]|nr:hypothetical protein [Patescibacteria group bacterium]
MSRVLSQLLQAKEPEFTMSLHQLEKAGGHSAVDVRLIADIANSVKQKTRELGLDQNDTTDKELYHALQSMIGLHDSYLSKIIGTKPEDTIETQLKNIQKYLKSINKDMSCWTMKNSVAKKMLKQHPPKNVMKKLGYKSIDSMLKREHISEIYVATRLLETSAWQKRLVKSYKKLTPSDFETRDIEVLYLNPNKWGDAANEYIYERRQNITHLKELGVLMILPLPVKKLRGLTITVIPLALHYMNEIRSYSAFFKLQQVRPDFGEVLVSTILDDPKTSAKIANQTVHWRIIQRHFGANSREVPETFEPHIQPEDLHWKKAESILYKIEPALKFWEHMDFVATLNTDNPVPLSLMDNAISYCNNLEYGQQSVGHFRTSLWNEIYARYMGIDEIQSSVLNQLNQSIISTELVED